MNTDNVKAIVCRQLRIEEQFRAKMYLDSEGKHTIGWGWNLDGTQIRMTEANTRLQNDIDEACATLLSACSWVNGLDDVRASVLIQLCFQLGLHGLLEFHNMLMACQAGNWPVAANQLLDSKYGREQCPARAARYAAALESGQVTV